MVMVAVRFFLMYDFQNAAYSILMSLFKKTSSSSAAAAAAAAAAASAAVVVVVVVAMTVAVVAKLCDIQNGHSELCNLSTHSRRGCIHLTAIMQPHCMLLLRIVMLLVLYLLLWTRVQFLEES